MSNTTSVLNVERKDGAGKGAARLTRKQGRVPGVVYGGGKDPVMVTFVPGDLERTLKNPAYYSTQFDLVFPDGTKEHVIPKAVQFDKVLDFPIHLDFLRVSGSTRVNVFVPVEFVNEEASPGLKRGGVLIINRHEVEVIATARTIPDKLIIDLTGLELNDAIKWSNVTVPEGVVPAITDRDFAIGNISAPTGMATTEDDSGDDAEEGESEE